MRLGPAHSRGHNPPGPLLPIRLSFPHIQTISRPTTNTSFPPLLPLPHHSLDAPGDEPPPGEAAGIGALPAAVLPQVPPRSMTITSDLDPGREVSVVAGPYTEGAEVTLTCQVRGGNPRPKVTWWHEWSLLDDTSEVNTTQVVKNILTLPPLTRADLNKTLTCQATNSDLIIPMSATVRLDMRYPPRSVKLLEESSEGVTLSEGRSRPVVCEATARFTVALPPTSRGSPTDDPSQVIVSC
ncbi:hypothetical protein C7M84_000540 [Penaeus vannamei]|uniref:Ig-like domain-containing protein n=1 Tax=Penaeus vannamei TaxID=6689 RepID=A0A3R7PB77_PENVA|nr:hypothetical protein C7M84_000540 [Penaeus vannamei]